MKKPLFISTVAIAVIMAFGVLLNSQQASSGSPGASGAVQWQSFENAITLAGEQNKKLLIDVYTDWCGWCKRMDSDVYSDASVIAALNAGFIPVKLNAESSRELIYFGSQMTEAQFARSAGVTGYPTTLFLGPDAKPITRVPGYIPADKFVSILNYIGQNHYQTLSFEEYLSRSTTSN